MSQFQLTPEQEETLRKMKQAEAEADRELEERLSKMTDQEKQEYLETQAIMAAKMGSSHPEAE